MTAQPRSDDARDNLPSDLQAVLANAWSVMSEGVCSRHAASHTPVLATVDAHGRPQARTVVLRGCEPAARLLRMHTDRRSGKAADLSRTPHAAIHIYDHDRKLQLRLGCTVTLHRKDDIAGRAWSETRSFSRACYQVTEAPGTPLASPEDAVWAPERTNDGADNFMALLALANEIDCLHLHHRGHRRAQFAWGGDAWRGAWAVP